MHVRQLFYALTATLALGLAACGDDNGELNNANNANNANNGDCSIDANYASIHDNLLSTNSCAISGCHASDTAQGGLDFGGGRDAVYMELTQEAVMQPQATLTERVSAGSAADSFLYEKVSNAQAAGGVMPPAAGVTLEACELNAIQTWIDNGAQQ